MGQKPSHVGPSKSKLPISWIARCQHTTRNLNPEQPIKFQYKTRRKTSDHHKQKCTNDPFQNNARSNVRTIASVNTLNNLNNHANQININNLKNHKNVNDMKCQIVKSKNVPIRTKSEPSLVPKKTRTKHRHRRKSVKSVVQDGYNSEKHVQQFGYEIGDVDEFLTKATIEKPANIPVVLAFPSVLYQTRMGGYQEEIQLHLGMVVNAVFKNKNWLYVQTPHAEEGYVSYAACLPLGIIPPSDVSTVPCWENSTDIFPKPSGNMTDTEKLSSRSECSGGRCLSSRRSRTAVSTCGERSVDRLYLRAAASAKCKGIRQTLLVVCRDYDGLGKNTLSVLQGDVVSLVSTPMKDWFWVRNKDGAEGFIPAVVAGHGFL